MACIKLRNTMYVDIKLETWTPCWSLFCSSTDALTAISSLAGVHHDRLRVRHPMLYVKAGGFHDRQRDETFTARIAQVYGSCSRAYLPAAHRTNIAWQQYVKPSVYSICAIDHMRSTEGGGMSLVLVLIGGISDYVKGSPTCVRTSTPRKSEEIGRWPCQLLVRVC